MRPIKTKSIARLQRFSKSCQMSNWPQSVARLQRFDLSLKIREWLIFILLIANVKREIYIEVQIWNTVTPWRERYLVPSFLRISKVIVQLLSVNFDLLLIKMVYFWCRVCHPPWYRRYLVPSFLRISKLVYIIRKSETYYHYSRVRDYAEMWDYAELGNKC